MWENPSGKQWKSSRQQQKNGACSKVVVVVAARSIDGWERKPTPRTRGAIKERNWNLSSLAYSLVWGARSVLRTSFMLAWQSALDCNLRSAMSKTRDLDETLPCLRPEPYCRWLTLDYEGRRYFISFLIIVHRYERDRQPFAGRYVEYSWQSFFLAFAVVVALT